MEIVSLSFLCSIEQELTKVTRRGIVRSASHSVQLPHTRMSDVSMSLSRSVWKCQPREDEEAPPVAVKLVHRTKTTTTAARVRSLWSEFKVRLHPSVASP